MRSIVCVGDGVLDVPAVKCYEFAQLSGEFAGCTARDVREAVPYEFYCNCATNYNMKF